MASLKDLKNVSISDLERWSENYLEDNLEGEIQYVRAIEKIKSNQNNWETQFEAVKQFLKDWHTHRGWKEKDWKCFKESFERALEDFKGIGGKNLETMCIDTEKNTIMQIFKSLSNEDRHCKVKRKFVATVKTMHLMRPEIFPIWDNYVGSYFFRIRNAADYVKFMEEYKALMKNIDTKKLTSRLREKYTDRLARARDLVAENTLIKFIDAALWKYAEMQKKQKS